MVAAVTKPATEEGADQRERLQRALGDGLKIRRLLGRGGFAEVWAAFDVRLKREVAVKTLRYDIVSSDSLLERFQREAEAVAKLRHPNIIPIYEVGEGKGVAYFVMPMIEGESLGEALDREGAFTVEETCRILREAGGALAAAHRAGIVHRDVKPDNLMLEGPERRPIVMDFGIAKATSSSEARLTGTGMAMGTPHYMSPEQASGEKELDARADQYALALVGYRMLAGKLPFDADSMQTMILKQITEVPKPVVTLRPDVPRQISDALARALSKDPAARFQTMEEFIGAIPAAGGESIRSSVRRRPTETEISRFPGAIRPSWREPHVLFGFASLLLIIGLTWWNRAPRETAAGRNNAMFVGRAFLTKEGASGPYNEDIKLAANDTIVAWIGKTLGPRVADTSSTWNRSMYRWTLRWTREASGTKPRESWSVGVSPGSDIVAFSQLIHDTMPGAKPSTDSASRIATRFLRDVGIDVASLKRVQDSTVSRAARTDHILAWEPTKPSVIAGRDTGSSRYRVTVAGDRIQDFRHIVRPPTRFITAARRETGDIVGPPFVAVLILTVGAGGLMLLIKRQRSDDLRWATATRIAVVAVVLLGVISVPSTTTSSIGATMAGLMALAFIGALIALALVVGIVVGESLANEVNPMGLTGLESLSRLRLSAPDWLPAVLRGLALGAVASALVMASEVIPAMLMWRHDTLPDGVNQSPAALLPLARLGAALCSAVGLFFVVHLTLRFVKRQWVAVVLPGAILAVFGILMGSTIQPWATGLGPAVAVSVLAFATIRYGFLATTVAVWTMLVLGTGIVLLATGESPFVGAGIACLASLAALPVLSMAAKRLR